MDSVIETYLKQLKKLLSKRLRPDVCQKILEEVRCHLRLAAKEFVAEGHDEAHAGLLAVQRFGESGLVAQELIRQHTGVNTKSAWKLDWLPLLLFSCSMLMFAVGRWPGLLAFFWFPLSRTLQAASLVAFLAAVAKSRRWLLAPMVSAVFIFAAAGACYAGWVSMRAPSDASSKAAQLSIIDQKELIREQQVYANAACLAVEEGKPVPIGAAYRANNGLPARNAPLVPTFNRQNTAYVVWGVTMPMKTEDNVTLDPAEPGVDATAIWKRDGARARAGLRDLEDEYGMFSAMTQSQKFNEIFAANTLKRRVGFALSSALVNSLVLALLNGLFLWLAGLSDRLRGKRTVRSSS